VARAEEETRFTYASEGCVDETTLLVSLVTACDEEQTELASASRTLEIACASALDAPAEELVVLTP
jgi:hypothetical protein